MKSFQSDAKEIKLRIQKKNGKLKGYMDDSHVA
jgi:hypothetical protein